MDGLQVVIFAKMYVLGIKSVPFNNTIETNPKEWISSIDIHSLSWDDKTWKENLKGSTLKRIKPWMWKRNIKAILDNK